MEVKKVTLAIVVVAVIIAGSLATLGNKKILSAQYRRYTSLIRQADQFLAGKKFPAAAQAYKQALIIDARDKKIWAKFEQSEKQAFLREAGASIPTAVPQATAPHNETITPQVQPQGGMIIEEDEGC
ncbi:MAG TPA: hypothetical protein ENJ30_01750 [Desulfobulbaceae bacterium]|nr:hypothetical protein [Desulfobulbaceae bacterium]